MGHCIDHFAHAPLSSTSITTLLVSRHEALFNNSSSGPIGKQLQGRSGPTKDGPAEASRLWQSIQDGPSSLSPCSLESSHHHNIHHTQHTCLKFQNIMYNYVCTKISCL